MRDDHPSDLESFIHEELRRLPEVPAPASLRQRVTKAVELQRAEAARPWWRNACWRWPAPARRAAFVIALAVGAVTSALPWFMDGVFASASAQAGQVLAPVKGWFDIATSVVTALDLVGRTVSRHPAVLAAAGGCLALYLFLVGVGSLYVRLGVSHSGKLVRYER